MTVTPLEPWLDKRALASHYGQSVRWVEARLQEGMPCAKIGRKKMFQLIGRCFGYGAHPASDDFYEQAGMDNPFDDPGVSGIFSRVPHPTLQPHRVHEITGVFGGEEEKS